MRPEGAPRGRSSTLPRDDGRASCGNAGARAFITHALGFLAHLSAAGVGYPMAGLCAHALLDGPARSRKPRTRQDVSCDDLLSVAADRRRGLARAGAGACTRGAWTRSLPQLP